MDKRLEQYPETKTEAELYWDYLEARKERHARTLHFIWKIIKPALWLCLTGGTIWLIDYLLGLTIADTWLIIAKVILSIVLLMLAWLIYCAFALTKEDKL
jgi:hypothetical protein